MKFRIKLDGYDSYLTQIALVTGGNSGIGLETVRALLRKGSKVYMAARNEAKARNEMANLLQDPTTAKGAVDFLHLDLASFRSIEQFVRELGRREQRLDLLFNNAGLVIPNSEGQKTAEGYEIHMGVNALGVYYLTVLLLPLLRISYQHSPTRPPRVCFTSSLAHRAAPSCGFDPTDPSGAHIRFRVLPTYMQAYANSKMAVILGMLRAHIQLRANYSVCTAKMASSCMCQLHTAMLATPAISRQVSHATPDHFQQYFSATLLSLTCFIPPSSAP